MFAHVFRHALHDYTDYFFIPVFICHCRLKTEDHGGAWCPKAQITSESREWLQIDLPAVYMITATNTQGRFGNGVGVEYAENYVLEYWRPRLGKWVRYSDAKEQEVRFINRH